MNGSTWFYDINLGILLMAIFVFLLFTSQIGFILGQRSKKRTSAGSNESSDFIPSTILGLLALILGFTFSMAINRFEHRKELVTREANAIGTTYLRSRLLPQQNGKEIRDLLKNYVDARLDFFDAGSDATHIRHTEEKAVYLQNQLWEKNVEIIRSDRSPIAGLFVSALNEMIDLQVERFIALQNHIPEIVYWVILFIAGCGLGSLNFIRGLQSKLGRWKPTLLALLFGVVITLIHDLDRPRNGTITVSQEAMIMLRNSIK